VAGEGACRHTPEDVHGLAMRVLELRQEALVGAATALTRSLEIGRLLCEYATRPAPIAEAARINEPNGPGQGKRPGRPWTPLGVAISQTVAVGGNLHQGALSAAWLWRCARAYEVARERGFIKGDVGDILGYAKELISQRENNSGEVGGEGLDLDLALPNAERVVQDPEHWDEREALPLEEMVEKAARRVANLFCRGGHAPVNRKALDRFLEPLRPVLEANGLAVVRVDRKQKVR
jgi:hypothetical protein